jgi:asparagine synthase (glutamine-hydrolysing)
MCGICGVVPADPTAPVDAALLAGMSGLLAHRGPDGAGAFRAPGVGLAVRRLAINDLVTGDQPISGEDGTITVACNGEIYNARELRQDLAARGHRFRTTSDVEAIVHLYEDRGPDCVRQLRGMFAFALWDGRRRRLMLARDRLGIKPLFYAVDGEGLLFASEQKALLPTGRIPRRPDPAALHDAFTFGFVRAPRTLLAAVHALRPGCYLLYEDGRAALHRYWQLAVPPRGEYEDRPARYWVAAFRDALEEAVTLHLRSDVPLGAWLSPGLDSSSVASLMRPHLPEPVPTFSLGFEDREADELGRHPTLDRFPGAGLAGHHVTCRSTDLDRLPHALWHGEDTIANSILIPRMVLAEASARALKVVLSGEGADELLGGYPWFAADRLLRPLGGLPRRVRQAMLLGPTLPRRWPWASQVLLGPRAAGIERFRRLIGLAHAEAGALLWSPDLRRELAGREEADEPEGRPADFARWHPFAQLQYYDLTVRLPDRVLSSVDRAAMAYGLEVRVPFLDHELVELCARMPPSLKLRGRRTKYVLRRAMRGTLPEAIRTRRKRGLTAPTAAWLRGPLPAFAATLLAPAALRDKGYFDPAGVAELLRRHRAGDLRYGEHLFGVLATQVWDELFVRGRAPAGIRAEPAGLSA